MIELTYGISGTFTSLAGLAMVLVYSLTNPWWRSHTGRMLITYAVAETGMSAMFAAAVVLHMNPIWFRWLWIGLQATVGCVLWYQTALIVHLTRQARESA
jgi:hypothetical protein